MNQSELQQIKRALSAARNALERGIEVRMMDQWPALAQVVPDAIREVKAALEIMQGWDESKVDPGRDPEHLLKLLSHIVNHAQYSSAHVGFVKVPAYLLDEPKRILEQSSTKVQPPKLQLREGGWYRREDGEVAGPAKRRVTGIDVASYPWDVGDNFYTHDGKRWLHPNTSTDLIAEVADEAQAERPFRAATSTSGVGEPIFKHPLADEPAPPKLQLREGGWYRTQDQRTIGPAKFKPQNRYDNYPWCLNGAWYNDRGQYCAGCSGVDLIAEVPPPTEQQSEYECSTCGVPDILPSDVCAHCNAEQPEMREITGPIEIDSEPEPFWPGDWVTVVSRSVFREKVGCIIELVPGKQDSLPIRVHFGDEVNWFGHKELRHATPDEVAKATEPKPTEPDADGWIAYDGKACPVDDELVVQCRTKNCVLQATKAKYRNWKTATPITHYRLVTPKPTHWTIIDGVEVRP